MTSKAVQAVIQVAEKRGAVIYAGDVMKLHDQGGQAQRILVISESFISYYKNAKKSEGDRCFFWKNLTEIKFYDNRCELYFTSTDQMRFFSSDMPVIKEKMLRHLSHYYTYEEWIHLGIPELDPQLRHCPIPRAAISRLKGVVYSKNLALSTEESSEAKRLLKCNKDHFDLPPLNNNAELTSAVLYSIMINPSIETVKIHCEVPSVSLKAMDKVMSTGCPWKFVSFVGGKQRAISDFMNDHLNCPESRLCSIEFRDTKFDPASLEVLNTFIQQNQIEMLYLSDSLHGEAQQAFLNMSVLNKMKGLGLSYVRLEAIEDLSTKFQNLTLLSLRDVQVSLSTILSAINPNTAPNLLALDVSMNDAAQAINTDLSLPPKLRMISVSDVEWDIHVLNEFVQVISKHRWTDGARIDFSSMNLSEAEVAEFISNMMRSSIPILWLNWSGNVLNNEVISLFRRFTLLRTLIMSDCLSSTDPDLISSFGSFLSNSHSIETLILRGSDSKSVADQYQPLLDGITGCGTLKYLDLSFQRLSDDGIRSLAEHVSHSDISTLAFDGSDIHDSSTIDFLLDQMKERGTPIRLSYPWFDLMKLNMSDDYIEKFIEVDIPRSYNVQPDDPLNEVFEVFTVTDISRFPTCRGQHYYKTLDLSPEVVESDSESASELVIPSNNVEKSVQRASSTSSDFSPPPQKEPDTESSASEPIPPPVFDSPSSTKSDHVEPQPVEPPRVEEQEQKVIPIIVEVAQEPKPKKKREYVIESSSDDVPLSPQQPVVVKEDKKVEIVQPKWDFDESEFKRNTASKRISQLNVRYSLPNLQSQMK